VCLFAIFRKKRLYLGHGRCDPIERNSSPCRALLGVWVIYDMRANAQLHRGTSRGIVFWPEGQVGVVGISGTRKANPCLLDLFSQGVSMRVSARKRNGIQLVSDTEHKRQLHRMRGP
jgi:hypothetical protein